jgi:hypothetical protein
MCCLFAESVGIMFRDPKTTRFIEYAIVHCGTMSGPPVNALDVANGPGDFPGDMIPHRDRRYFIDR